MQISLKKSSLVDFLIFSLAFFLLLFPAPPLTVEKQHLTRQLLIIMYSLWSLIYWSLVIWKTKKLSFSLSRLDFFLLLFSASIWLSFFSTIYYQPSTIYFSLTSLFGPLTFTALTILYFFAKTFLSTNSFGFKFIIIITVITIITFIFSVVFSQKSSFALDHQSGWYIAAGSMKNVKNALFGFGPGNFPLALAQNRPPSLWPASVSSLSVPFQSNLYFQILTEYGLISLFFFLLVIFKTLSNLGNLGYFVSFSIVLLYFALFPPNLIMLALFFVLLALFGRRETGLFSLNLKIPRLFPFLIFLFSLTSLVLLGRLYFAEIYYKKALDSQKGGVAKTTYRHLAKAIELNGFNPDYYVLLARISLVSTLSYAKNETGSADASRREKNLESFFAQTIKAAKKAVALAPDHPVYYFNLAEIYANSATYVVSAADYAAQNYLRAINYDPQNPNYHFSLGKLYQLQKKYDLAQKEFETAVTLDTAFANAYYNLYFVLRQQKLYQQALSSLAQTKRLLSLDHPQFSQITQELRAFEFFVREVTVSGNLDLTLPPVSTSSPSLLKQSFGSLPE